MGGVVEGVGSALRGRNIEGVNGAVDQLGPVHGSAIAQKAIHHLAAAHADVLVVLEGVANVDLNVGRGDHFHLPHAAIDDIRRQIKLFHHTQGNGPAAGFGVVELALK